jgi:hypothetical protein
MERLVRRTSADVRESVVPARIDFEDENGARLEANFELLYHGGGKALIIRTATNAENVEISPTVEFPREPTPLD